MTRKPCLAEEWFIEGAIESFDGMCTLCKDMLQADILRFGHTIQEGLSQIYKLSRGIRVHQILAGHRPENNPWEVLHMLGFHSAPLQFGDLSTRIQPRIHTA